MSKSAGLATRIKKTLNANAGFLVFLLAIFFVRATLANQYHVPSGSMIPTLMIGDRILVDRTAYDIKVPLTKHSIAKTGEPRRGDIIVFESVEEDGVVLVKRLIGVPGDEIKIDDGFLFVNGEKVSHLENGVETSSGEWLYSEAIGDVEFQAQRVLDRIRPEQMHVLVPVGHYFMMGDNRDLSHDSRRFGFVPRSHLIGRARLVLFSLTSELEADLSRTGHRLR